MNKTKRFVLQTMTLNQCTIGKLYIEYIGTGDRFMLCHTLENPWLNNKPFVSCIPAGDYIIKPTVSNKFGETYFIESIKDNVVGLEEGTRTHILFHKGNTEKDTSGCILPGQTVGCLGGETAVLNSSQAMKALMEELDGYDYKLTIFRH